MIVNFRYHRGGFKESMETKIQYEFVSLLKLDLQSKYDTTKIDIEYYSYDERLNKSGADTYIVTANNKVVGFLWYEEGD